MRFFRWRFFLLLALLLVAPYGASAYHEAWHDCISVSAPASGTTGSTEDAGSILFSDPSLKSQGQNGTDDEVYNDVLRSFLDLYPNVTAYRTCIDTDHRNESEPEFYHWYFSLRGWSYSDNLGWISFNCQDWDMVSGSGDVCAATDDYKVSIDVFGYLHGYAWSTKTGWIQFDWNIDGCSDYISADPLCPLDDFYFEQTSLVSPPGERIPLGRVYDNLTGRDDTFSGSNPAGGSASGGIGRFYGYAWNSTLGWFDFHDAWGVEDSDSFCPTDDGCGEVWRPGSSQAEVRIVNEASEIPYSQDDRKVYGAVVADGLAEYRVQIRFRDIRGDVIPADKIDSLMLDTSHIGLASFFTGETNTTRIDQISASGEHSMEVFYPDSNKTDSSGRQSYFTNGAYDIDVDNWVTVVYLRSLAPTSNMNGVDFNGDGTLDVLADGSFFYRLEGLDVESVDFSESLLTAIPLVEDVLYFQGTETSFYPVSLKFFPAIQMSSLKNDGDFYITTSRGQETPFTLDLKKNFSEPLYWNLNGPYVQGFSLQLTLGVNGMDPSEFPREDPEAPFHFVFDTNGNSFFDFEGDSYVSTLDSTRTNGLSSSEGAAWSAWVVSPTDDQHDLDIIAVPVLNSTMTAEERVEGPSIRSEIAYTLDLKNIRYKGQSLDETSESVYNPAADIQGLINLRNITEVQTGVDTVSIGDIRTNVARNVLYKNVRSVSAGASLSSGSGEVNENGITGGTELYDSNNDGRGEVYYFRDGDVTIRSTQGIPDPYVGNYRVIGWNEERTIIVDGGNLFLDANLGYVFSGSDYVPASQIGIIVLKGSDGKGGNIYVHPDVTNVRAIFFADGVIAGYDGFGRQSDDVETRESDLSLDLNGHNGFADVYRVPKLETLSCPSGSDVGADPLEVFHNQLLFQGIVTSLENTLGGTDDPAGPRIGTGEILVPLDRSKKLAQQYDFNFLRSYRLTLERHNPSGFPADQQCNHQPTYYFEGQYYTDDDRDGNLTFATDTFGCSSPAIDSTRIEADGGDLIGRDEAVSGFEVLCASKDAQAFLPPSVVQSYSPLMVVYESISPTLPVFWDAGSDFATQRQINR